MKQLLVLRHAKASRDRPDLDDHERPLDERGERDAPRMGRLLRRMKLAPDRIVSSTAVRARSTAEEVALACGYRRDIVLTRQLYLADTSDCIALLRELPAADALVLLVGHNPTFEELVELFSGRAERFPTAGLAWIALPCDAWGEITPRVRGELLALWRPKELPPSAG